MKKLLIVLVSIFIFSSCTYNEVDENTKMSVKAQNYSLTLKDSVDGLYLFKDKRVFKDRDYLFKKDSTSVKLIEKYKSDDSGVNINFIIFAIFIVLFIVFIGVALGE